MIYILTISKYTIILNLFKNKKMFFTKLLYHKYAILDFFIPLSNRPWSMLLHSGYNNHKDARFDILVASPDVTLITTQKTTTIHYKNNYKKKSTQDPFYLLQKEIKLSNMKYTKNFPLPFQGGYVGIFGYDLIRQIENLPNIAKQDINIPDMAIGLYRWTIIADHKSHTLQLISHDEPKKLLIWLKDLMKNTSHKDLFKLQSPWKSNMTRDEYSKKFYIIHQHLKKGNCYQICLAQRFSALYTGNEWTAFQYLLKYNHAPFSAFIRLPNQVILSLSPERFVQLQNSNIKTQPIKGTISRLKNTQQDNQQIEYLISSNKNKSENLMIVDLLRNDIGRVAIPGSIKVPTLFEIQTFSAVHHMVSTIIGKLNDTYSAYDLLRNCFPGGSITGAPKIQAMKIIEELEPHKRNAWSGSIGYISCCGNMDTNIAIRTILAEKHKLFCSVGSGITYDSYENIEYEEMIAKVSTLLPILSKYHTNEKIYKK